MKTATGTVLSSTAKLLLILSFMLMQPASGQAQQAEAMSVEMSMPSYLIIGFLLLLSISMFFIFQRRYQIKANELADLTAELATTRGRLTSTSTDLEKTQKTLKTTTQHFEGLLLDARVGVFQIDPSGKCFYVNDALQKMSGLHLKKALKEGFASAIHPDDRPRFTESWNHFTENERELEFHQMFRFRLPKEQDVHVDCRVGKIRNAKKDVESYIGWVTNTTALHERELKHKAEAARYGHFVAETIEGYYKLVPERPILLSPTPSRMTDLILEKMVLADCNDTFAAMYGAQPSDLSGKAISELKDGCGPFMDKESLKAFVEDGYKCIEVETVRQDPNGNRITLLHHVIGMVEDNRLVGIWGAQRNISHQKREEAALRSQLQFLNRVLNSLPGDIYVKDTRCRYLYASRKLADRTGIAQDEWIGKTIFEVMPGTSKEHDRAAIDTMKAGLLTRTDRPFEARGKSGWMETVQIPLISEQGLVEGVIGLSLDITERKRKEEEARKVQSNLENQLKQLRGELSTSQAEHKKANGSLSEATHKLRVAEAEKNSIERDFTNKLEDRQRIEDALRHSEESLKKRVTEFEHQLIERMDELKAETDKRKKWEELLSIKEDELRKAEELGTDLENRYEKVCELRDKAESELSALRRELEKQAGELNQISALNQNELDALKTRLETDLSKEQTARTATEKRLEKTEAQLQRTQAEMQQANEQYAAELEKEVAERKASAEKLMHAMEELDALKENFNTRIEEETRAMKQELAQKQIREKSLRQHEKDLEDRISELEKLLNSKSEEYARQIQAREDAELKAKASEQRVEQLSRRQQDIIAREAQKLNLQIAEIRLDEVKLRKQVGDLQKEKERLEEELAAGSEELRKAETENRRKQIALNETEGKLKEVSESQDKMIARETEKLRKQLDEFRKSGEELHQQLMDLKVEKQNTEITLKDREGELSKAADEYRKLSEAFKESQKQFKDFSDEQDAQLTRRTKELSNELQNLKKSEAGLRTQEEHLREKIQMQQQRMDEMLDRLNGETAKRRELEKELGEVQGLLKKAQRSTDSIVTDKTKALKDELQQVSISEGRLKQELADARNLITERDALIETREKERKEADARIREIESKLSTIRGEYQAELSKSTAEIKEITRKNSKLVDELSETMQECLNPVIKSTLIMEGASNLSTEQKHELVKANNSCRSLMDMMNYRGELTRLADGDSSSKVGECDLHAVMTEIDNQFSHRAEAKKLFFAVSFAQYQAAHNVPRLVETDEYKVRRILSILLGYAVQVTDKGRLGLHATRRSCEGEMATIAFELAYTGRYGNDDLLSGIFAADADGSVVDMKYGLTLARRYITMLDGEVGIEYRPGGITSLTVQFPFKKIAVEEAVEEPGKNNEDEEKAGAA